MLHQTFLFLGQLWQLFEVSQILEFFTVICELCYISEKEITVRSSSDCRSYDLDDYSEINIHYEGDTLFGECEIEIDADEDYPRICIEAEKLFFDACAAEIEVHAGFVTSSSDKVLFTVLVCHHQAWL